jgi:pSer/pThr/pTyr-binding forkhead associated (FHA) protein
MAKLILKFEAAVIKEVPVGSRPITVGRAPDNDLHVDNLAISSHHARIYVEEGKLVVEDLNSLNGTFVNNQRVQKTALKNGDSILVGKHTIVVQDTGDAPLPIPEAPRKVAAPKVEETVMMDAKRRKELLQQAMAAASGGAAPPAAGLTPQQEKTATVPPPRVRIPTVVVLSGNTDQKEYHLSGKLTVIGKSEMATIKLTGFFTRLFAPEVAAQINKRDDGYYIGPAGQAPKVNSQTITGPTKLSDGDVIEVGKVKMNFVYRD